LGFRRSAPTEAPGRLIVAPHVEPWKPDRLAGSEAEQHSTPET
jgi:hypothetical protein